MRLEFSNLKKSSKIPNFAISIRRIHESCAQRRYIQSWDYCSRSGWNRNAGKFKRVHCNRSDISFNDIKEEIAFVREECPWKRGGDEGTVPVENVDRNVQSTRRT